MRSPRHLLVALALAAAGGLSSCVVPLSTADQNCVSYCMLLQGCGSPAAPGQDCNAWCDGFLPVVEHTGCKSAFDEAATCLVGEGTCQGATCTAAAQAYSDCTQQFCAQNPADTACQTGS